MESNRTRRQKKNRQPQGLSCVEVFAEGEDAHVLRLESKLSDLQTEHANSFVHTHEWNQIKHVDKKRTDNHKGLSCVEVFAEGEDAHVFRLESKLSDLQT